MRNLYCSCYIDDYLLNLFENAFGFLSLKVKRKGKVRYIIIYSYIQVRYIHINI